MRVVGVNRTKHRGIGRLYRSGGGRVAGGGGGGGGGMPVGTRGKQQEEEATGYRDGEVGIADGDGDGRVNVLALALGHGELRPTTQGSSLLCTERAGERNVRGTGGGRRDER